LELFVGYRFLHDIRFRMHSFAVSDSMVTRLLWAHKLQTGCQLLTALRSSVGRVTELLPLQCEINHYCGLQRYKVNNLVDTVRQP
jgi:hypothetical protein